MARNIDLAALRSFLTVADVGGVTRAATHLNLTQSAVSLQIKRLETSFGQPLFERRARGVVLTSQGEQFVSFARRLVALNDETWARMTAPVAGGEIHIGVPDDLLYPHVPKVIHAFAQTNPRVRVRIQSGLTMVLKEQFDEGTLDLLLASEPAVASGGETLVREPLVWIGVPGGQAWRQRPLPVGTVARCLFTKPAIAALDAAGIDWRLGIDSGSSQAVEASIAADIVVHMLMQSTVCPQFEAIRHGGALPALPMFCISMYVTPGPRRRLADSLAERFRAAYAGSEAIAAE
jgi:DNA-binding transcriptional LysR family regulator